MILDVGCGADPKGDVNVDRFLEDRTQCFKAWFPWETKNFVFADAEYLPFKDKAFSLLLARHLIEHLENPLQALKEWSRVAEEVKITTPSAYNLDKTPTHLYTWNIFTLENLAKQVFPKVRVRYTGLRNVVYGRFLKRIPLLALVLNRFPSELEAVCGQKG